MRAVLVFCEGYHDVIFTTRSLGAVGHCSWIKVQIKDLPSPFGKSDTSSKGLIATRIERQGIDDLNLQMASHPSLPSFEAIVKDEDSKTMFIMVRTHGKDQIDDVQKLLRELNDIFDPTLINTYDVTEYAAAFLFDANAIGMTETINDFRQRYSNHFGVLSGVDHGTWVTTGVAPVGCFVFHDENNEDLTGTLEDCLAPMVKAEWPDRREWRRRTVRRDRDDLPKHRYAKAHAFIDEGKKDSDEVSRSRSLQLKAAITAAGQFRVPGAGLTQVTGRHGLSKTAFEESVLSKELVTFLKSTPWP